MREKDEDAILLALKMEARAVNQGMQVASRSWKRKGDIFSPRASRRNTAYQHLNFSPMKPISGV